MDSHGGWIASSVDLARFLVHFDGSTSKRDLISKPTYNLMTTSSLNNNYAKGWLVNSVKNIWHDGSLPGTGAFFMTSPSWGISGVILMNSGYTSKADPMMWEIIKGINGNWPKNLDLF